jgi:hypothetical protein
MNGKDLYLTAEERDSLRLALENEILNCRKGERIFKKKYGREGLSYRREVGMLEGVFQKLLTLDALKDPRRTVSK